MKFGQLIENNMRNIFLEKSYAKCDGDAITKTFSKKIKIVEGQVEDYQNMSKLSCIPPAFTSNKAF